LSASINSLTPPARPVFITVGGSFILAVQDAFNNQVANELVKRLAEINPATILGTGAMRVRESFSAAQVPVVLDAYMVGLKAVFAIMIASHGVSTVLAVFGSWKRINEGKMKKAAGGAA
jgi:hypothetical protein